jgi:hypothetical protein
MPVQTQNPISECYPQASTSSIVLSVTESYVILYCVYSARVFTRDDSLTMTYSMNFPGRISPRPAVIELPYQLYIFANLNTFLIMAEILNVPERIANNESAW